MCARAAKLSREPGRDRAVAASHAIWICAVLTALLHSAWESLLLKASTVSSTALTEDGMRKIVMGGPTGSQVGASSAAKIQS